ncbi:MAG: hypothetical protein QM736_11310 [Vicinamibacterales bacterium]
MNNVGEFFFSSPIDPFDVNKDWGRSDDDQRHRRHDQRFAHTRRRRPATTPWQAHLCTASSSAACCRPIRRCRSTSRQG